ncbi:methylated-DNA--[protein]-cysteine S-methyltransferase [Idiomarina piscisalsi]|uniref:methylated-DNA--[protein]-cysteine S-methyltransferase n=1 Tax=Idiomarina piscisalsi TaxID=1096243 RepID=UPI00137D74BF|nr:methylated-DNA--[protein]-cysteine S-methyltransferase [Idiomarina piscisalsi]MTJ02955.1 methylated-DNA--[protein]-cysteine S-methyltransferase [Idiomarina piscisalsi]
MYYSEFSTPLGTMYAVADSQHILGLYYQGQKYCPDMSQYQYEPEQWLLEAATRQIQRYFSEPGYEFYLPLNPNVTSFQKSVLDVLQQIPSGKTLSYQQVASKLGKPTATRAVASAIAKNPVIIVIPCHRVIGQDGSLRGFAAGLDRKQQLLDREKQGSKAVA